MARQIAWLCGLMFLCSLPAVLAAAPQGSGQQSDQPPTYFVKKATWLETVIASREALARQQNGGITSPVPGSPEEGVRKQFAPLEVEMTGADKPRKVKLPVGGVKRLYLATRGARGFFADVQMTDLHGGVRPLDVGQAVPRGWGRRRQDQTVQRGDQVFARILDTRDSEYAVDLNGQAAWVEIWIGASDTKDSRPVRFCVDSRSVIERMRTQTSSRENVWAAAAEAFPDPAYIYQRGAEELAGIWTNDWKAGDLAELAIRYAKGCDVAYRKQALKRAKDCPSLADLQAVRDLFYASRAGARLELARRTLALVQRVAPRPEMAAELASLEKQLPEVEQGKAPGESFYANACRLRRRIILSHPALDFPKLLINERTGSLPEHMCDQYLGRHSRAAPGLVLLEDWKNRPQATVLLEGKLPVGGLIQPCLSYDGHRVVFAFADHTSPRQGQLRGYYLYEYNFATDKVRQITGTDKDPLVGRDGRQTVLIEDMDPCYLPDGGIAFLSTRSQQYGRCHGGRYVPSYTLYRGELDGSNIRPLSFNEANEWGPSVLHDGSLVYCRWDYINRHDTIFQSLWTMRPDGTQTAHYYGNNSPAPCLISEPQAIPDSHKVVATAAAHHGQTLGTLIVIDPYKGQEHGEPLTWITPELSFPESGVPAGITKTEMPLPEDTPEKGRAATPWPLSEDLFLCTYQRGLLHAIYLIDTAGGRELIYADPRTSCFDPIPLRARPMPAAVPSFVAGKDDEKTGVFYVQDVYKSMQPIPRGTVKSLRVNQLISQPTSSAPPRSSASNEVV